MQRANCSLASKRAPGDTGVEFHNFETFKRTLIVSSPQENAVCITVGCYTITLTSEEALAIAKEVLSLAGNVQSLPAPDTKVKNGRA